MLCCAEVFLWVIRKTISSTTNHGRQLMRINLFTSGDNSGWAPETEISWRTSYLRVFWVSWAPAFVRHFVLVLYDAPVYLKHGDLEAILQLCLMLFMERGGDEQAVESAFLFWVTHLVTVAPRHPHTAFFLQYIYYFYRTSFFNHHPEISQGLHTLPTRSTPNVLAAFYLHCTCSVTKPWQRSWAVLFTMHIAGFCFVLQHR